MTSSAASLAKQHAETLAQFKQALIEQSAFIPERHTDGLLCRFLRARKYHLAVALEMFLAYQRWRREEDIDSLLHYRLPADVASQLSAIYPRFYHKTAKNGCPLYFEIFKDFDLKAVLRIVDEKSLFKQYVANYEQLIEVKLPACSKAADCVIEGCITIIDLAGTSTMDCLAIKQFVGKISGLSQNYYPEMLNAMYLINIPFLVKTVLSMLLMLVDERTRSKIHLFGGSYREALLKEIEPESLPKFFGGTCECPGGCKHSNAGPWNISA